ncbi:anaerobic typically selenocysteine-containing protein [Methylobacterium sp. A54F]
MRLTFPALGIAALAALTIPAWTVPAGAQEPAAASRPGGAAMPTVELTVTLADGKPTCAPAELRLPADTNVELYVVSHANQPVTLTIPGQFEQGHVLHADGDLIHVMSEKGYLVKQNGKGTLRLKTMKAGQYSYACTSTQNQKAPFTGTLTLAPAAG